MSDADHLHESTRALLDLPVEARIDKVQTKRWIPYQRARAGYAKMERLLKLPRQQRPENLAVIAPTANGKSMLMERFAQNHPAQDNADGDHAVVPVLLIEIPEEPTLDSLYRAILDRLFSPTNPRATRADRRREVFRQLTAIQLKALLIDEVHNLVFAGPGEREKILAFLRSIGNDPSLRASIVCAGTEDARRMLQSDPQLLNRFDIHPLPIWKDGESYRELLASFESLLPLRRPSYLGEDDQIVTAVLAMSEGLVGEMFKILSRAAVLAIRTGEESITIRTLAKIDYQSPKARRVQVEDLSMV